MYSSFLFYSYKDMKQFIKRIFRVYEMNKECKLSMISNMDR